MRFQIFGIAVLTGLLIGGALWAEPTAPLASTELVIAGWQALEKKEWDNAVAQADQCIKLYAKQARATQMGLEGYPDGKKKPIKSYWALNDVATAFYIKAEALRQSGREEEARAAYQELREKYRYGQCWDPRGWFWKPAEIAQERLRLINAGIREDFGDLRSETLVQKAWQALEQGDVAAVLAYANECLALYGSEADTMAAAISVYPQGTRDEVSRYWALNDMATIYFIKGEALRAAGKIDEAKLAFRDLIGRYRYGQCWDPKGWWWKPAEGALDKLFILETGLPLDFGDYSSQTLMTKAWSALDKEEFDLVFGYTEKCIKLYADEAEKMQGQLTDFAQGEMDDISKYWALNDVGTAHFIRARAFALQGKNEDARQEYQELEDKYFYSQCWDPKGWWWRPAEAARGILNTLVDTGTKTK